jgi:hypothetical protein
LGSVLGARRRRHPDAQNLTAPKVEDNKGVEASRRAATNGSR